MSTTPRRALRAPRGLPLASPSTYQPYPPSSPSASHPSSPAASRHASQPTDHWSSDPLVQQPSTSSASSSRTKTSYTSFSRPLPPAKKPKSMAGRIAAADGEDSLGKAREVETFSVGDTVLVSVMRGGAGVVLPGIGVLVEMWERSASEEGEDDEEKDEDETGKKAREEEEGEGEGEGMWVRIKWFQRIKELPEVMRRRLAAEAGKGGVVDPLQIYYTSALARIHEFTSPVALTNILAHCTVLSSSPHSDPLSARSIPHPLAGFSSKSKKKKNSSAEADPESSEDAEEREGAEEEEEEEDDPDKTFTVPAPSSTRLGSFQHGRLTVPREYWCAGVCDSGTGQVWELEAGDEGGWERVRRQGLERPGLEGWIVDRPAKKGNGKGKDKGKGKEKEVKQGKGSTRASSATSRPTTTKRTRSLSPNSSSSSSSSSSSEDDSDASSFSHSSGSDSDDSIGSASSSSDEADELPEPSDDEDDTLIMTPSRKRKRPTATASADPQRRGKKVKVDGKPTIRRTGGGKGKGMGTGTAKGTTREKKKKEQQEKKIRKTIKRLKEPKSRPLVDLPEQRDLPLDPYARALHLLHVGATPESLPCREEEYADVLVKIEGVIEGGGGGCVYISGQPGTGKTATVHAVVRELKQKARDFELPPFEYVEINGLKIPDPGHAYVVLWEAISGAAAANVSSSNDLGSDHLLDGDEHVEKATGGGAGKKVSSKAALRGLEAHFSGKGTGGVGGPRRCTYVVLMDELDQLFTTKQDVVYNFFNWPTLPGSQLVVIAVANTMDMPEKLAGRVKSRMGMERINFPPYTRDQLIEIAQSRLIPHPNPPPSPPNAPPLSEEERKKEATEHQVIESEALMLAAARTTGVTGDARRMLDVCRRAVEVALIPPLTTSSSATAHVPRPVKTRQILAVLQEMSRNPTAQFVRNCSLYEKVMLAAVVRGVRKLGVGELEWGKLKSDHALILSSLLLLPPSQTRLSSSQYLLLLASLTSSYVLSTSASSAGVGSGALAMVGDGSKVGLGTGVDESEVGRVLRDLKGEVGGERWRGMFE